VRKDKTAFVTGGSGAVGRAIVRVLAHEGYRVAYSYHSGRDAARQLDRELATQALPVTSFCLDVTDGQAVMALAEDVERDLGPVDVLVNNAGIAQVLPFVMIEEADWDRMMDVNLKSMFLVTKAFVRGMIRRQRGSIINVGSLAGVRMLEVPVHYAAAKSAVTGFTLALAKELGRYGVRVNAVVPGMLDEGVSSNVPDKQKQQYESHCALSRVGTCAEVAQLVAFLASNRSSYVNGQSIQVDGGI
jgi:3-oxoacyl-[acyl-carrier protein] reductase